MTDRLTLATESIARNTEILTLVSLQIPLVAGVGMTHLYFNILRDQRPGALLTAGCACIYLGLYANFFLR